MTINIEVTGYSYEGPALNEIGESTMQLPQKRRDADNLIKELFRRLHNTESRLAAAEATIDAALAALATAPEINPSNYDHDQVCVLNREACFAFSVLNTHTTARGKSR